MVDYKELFNQLDIKWPKQLLFIGSGVTPTPKEWLNIPSVRTNARTLGKFPENEINTIMTWNTQAFEGLGGVLGQLDKYKKECSNIIIFDDKSDEKVVNLKNNLILFGVKNRFTSEAFKDYINISDKFRYSPRNSTGFYIILWLLYADVEEIYISGYDGHKALSGLEVGKWNTKKPYYDIDGNVWIEDDMTKISIGKLKNFYTHSLTTEWLAIEEAIKVAENRGIKIKTQKD